MHRGVRRGGVQCGLLVLTTSQRDCRHIKGLNIERTNVVTRNKNFLTCFSPQIPKTIAIYRL